MENHADSALAAALELRTSFRALRDRWLTLGYAGMADVRLRVGLACGPVTRVEIGYQTSRLTVIGAPVNGASNACNAGPRDRDTIIVEERFRARCCQDHKVTEVRHSGRDNLFELV